MTDATSGDWLWIDGTLTPISSGFSLRRDAAACSPVILDVGTNRATLMSVLSTGESRKTAKRWSWAGPHARNRVQACSADGSLRCLSFSCVSLWTKRGAEHTGLFFDLRDHPRPQRSSTHGRRTGPVRLAIDGHLVLDPIVESRLEKVACGAR